MVTRVTCVSGQGFYKAKTLESFFVWDCFAASKVFGEMSRIVEMRHWSIEYDFLIAAPIEASRTYLLAAGTR